VAGRTVVVGAGQQALVGHAGQRELHVRRGGVQQHGKPGAAIGVDRPVGQGLILQVQQFRAGPHQPVVAPAQPDQVLVQAVDRPAVGRQVPGTVREGGPDLGVAVSALVLDAAEGLLVARVDARRARHGQCASGRETDKAACRPRKTMETITMSELPLDDAPGDVAAAAHNASRGHVVYLTEHGERLAVIVPAEFGPQLERLSPDELAELLEDFADAATARHARASIEAGEPLIPWEQVKAEAGL